MSFQIVDDRDYYAAPLGDFGIIPLVYVAAIAAVSAGTLVYEWLTKDEWSVGEYNAHMDEMYHTILLWDQIGWKKGCWTDAARRARWVLFMNAFGKHYNEHGQISGVSFVSDSEEKPARALAQQLATWGDELNASCAIDIPSNVPAPPKAPTEPIDYLQWGVYAIFGILALQFVGAFRSATAPMGPSRR